MNPGQAAQALSLIPGPDQGEIQIPTNFKDVKEQVDAQTKVQRNPLLFEEAAQSDILRAHQKDVHCKKRLEDDVLELSNTWIGQHFTLRHQKNLKLASSMLYAYFSSLRGVQTLGEEFCDIRQVETKNNIEPSLLTRLKLFFWSELFPYLYEYVITKLNVITRPNYAGVPLSEAPWRTKFNNFCQRLIPLLKDTKNYLSKMHLGSFYFGGKYYEWSKRLSGIKYIFDRPVGMYRSQYHILGLLIFIQLFVSTISFLKTLVKFRKASVPGKEWIEESYPTSNNAVVEQPDCVLCLEPRKYPTVAECGHVFCWNCIHDSCQNKPECPLCRQPILPQNLTRIYHYSA